MPPHQPGRQRSAGEHPAPPGLEAWRDRRRDQPGGDQRQPDPVPVGQLPDRAHRAGWSTRIAQGRDESPRAQGSIRRPPAHRRACAIRDPPERRASSLHWRAVIPSIRSRLRASLGPKARTSWTPAAMTMPAAMAMRIGRPNGVASNRAENRPRLPRPPCRRARVRCGRRRAAQRSAPGPRTDRRRNRSARASRRPATSPPAWSRARRPRPAAPETRHESATQARRQEPDALCRRADAPGAPSAPDGSVRLPAHARRCRQREPADENVDHAARHAAGARGAIRPRLALLRRPARRPFRGAPDAPSSRRFHDVGNSSLRVSGIRRADLLTTRS